MEFRNFRCIGNTVSEFLGKPRPVNMIVKKEGYVIEIGLENFTPNISVHDAINILKKATGIEWEIDTFYNEIVAIRTRENSVFERKTAIPTIDKLKEVLQKLIDNKLIILRKGIRDNGTIGLQGIQDLQDVYKKID